MVPKQQRIVCFLITIISVWFSVFPTTAISGLQQQQQDPLSARQLLPHKTAVLSQQSESFDKISPGPILKDSDLEVELVTEGLRSPTSMAFIGNHGDMLILEKSGEVILFINENKSKITLMNFTVNDQTERGLLGVAVTQQHIRHTDQPQQYQHVVIFKQLQQEIVAPGMLPLQHRHQYRLLYFFTLPRLARKIDLRY